MDNLGADDDGATLQEECEVAGEVEASCEPPALGNVQLRAALVGEGADVEDGVLERDRVERPAVPDGAELGDGDAVRARPRRRLVPQLAAGAGRAARGGGQHHHQCQDDLQSRAALPSSWPQQELANQSVHPNQTRHIELEAKIIRIKQSS